MILRYDELLHDPVCQGRDAFEFLNLDYTNQTDAFLNGASGTDGNVSDCSVRPD